MATIFGLPYEDVPDPLDRDREEGTEGRWRSALYEWLDERFGLIPWEFGIWGEERPFLRFGGGEIEYNVAPPGLWIAQVKSPRIEGTHAVVMKGPEVVWDPHPQREEGHRGFDQAMIFLPRRPLAARDAVVERPDDSDEFVWGAVPVEFCPALKALHEAWGHADPPIGWPEFVRPLVDALAAEAAARPAEQVERPDEEKRAREPRRASRPHDRLLDVRRGLARLRWPPQ